MKINAVVETAIYVNDLQGAESFYGTILGLPVIGKEPGRHVFFRVGEASVLLAFLAEATLKGDQLPPHGATGRAISPWALKQKRSRTGGSTCSVTASS